MQYKQKPDISQQYKSIKILPMVLGRATCETGAPKTWISGAFTCIAMALFQLLKKTVSVFV